MPGNWHAGLGKRMTEKGPMGTSPAAYFTWEGAGKGLPRENLAGGLFTL